MNPATELHWSQLSKMRITPQDYKHYMTDGFGSPTAAMELGTAVDAIVFNTTARVAVFDGKTRNGKKWESFKVEHLGQEIIMIVRTDSHFAPMVGSIGARVGRRLTRICTAVQRTYSRRMISWSLL